MLTASRAGAVAGPMLIASLDYRMAAPVISGLMLVSASLPLWAGRRDFVAAARRAAHWIADGMVPEVEILDEEMPALREP